MLKNSTLTTFLVFFCALGFIAAPIICAQDIYFYCPDEVLFLRQGQQIFQRTFTEKDLNGNCGGDAMVRRNPRFALYILGGLDLAAQKTQKILYNVDRNIIRKILLAVIAAGSTTLFYLLVKTSVSQYAGMIAVMFLLINPYFQLISRSVLLELPMLFFTLCALLELVYLEKKLQYPLPWKSILRFGFLAGMAVSCKLYAFPLYPSFLIIILSQKTKFVLKDRIKAVFLIVFCGLAIFVVTNSSLRHNFFEGIKDMTINHLSNKNGGGIYTRNYSGALNIFLYPFALFGQTPFTMSREIKLTDLRMIDFIGVFLGYLLLMYNLIKKNFIVNKVAYVWGANSFIFMWLVMVSLPSCTYISKIFLIPSIDLIWIILGMFQDQQTNLNDKKAQSSQ